MQYEAIYSFNIRRHMHVEFLADTDEQALELAKSAAWDAIETEQDRIRNIEGFSDTDVLDPVMSLDQKLEDGSIGEVVCEGESLPGDEPPLDLIAAARALLAVIPAEAPDWLDSEADALADAVRQYADVQTA